MAVAVITYVAIIETSENNLQPSINFHSQKLLSTFPHGLRNARLGMALIDERDNLRWTHIFGESTPALQAAMEAEFGPENQGPRVA